MAAVRKNCPVTCGMCSSDDSTLPTLPSHPFAEVSTSQPATLSALQLLFVCYSAHAFAPFHCTTPWFTLGISSDTTTSETSTTDGKGNGAEEEDGADTGDSDESSNVGTNLNTDALTKCIAGCTAAKYLDCKSDTIVRCFAGHERERGGGAGSLFTSLLSVSVSLTRTPPLHADRSKMMQPTLSAVTNNCRAAMPAGFEARTCQLANAQPCASGPGNQAAA
jgi:hypothetical protein